MPVESHLFKFELSYILGSYQRVSYKKRTDRLTYQSCKCNACSSHMESGNKDQVQYNVGQTADDHIVKRPESISFGAKYCSSEIIDEHENAGAEVDPHI